MKIVSLASSSRGNAHLVHDGETKLLLDCGLPFAKLKAALWEHRECTGRLSHIQGCLVSHEHKDHARAARELSSYGVDIWASLGTLTALGLVGNYRSRELRGIRTIGSWEIRGFRVEHPDAADPRGFFLHSTETQERLLYVTDTAYVVPLFSGLTHIMIACNWSEGAFSRPSSGDWNNRAMRRRVRSHHMSLERVIAMLEANDLSRVEEIHLLHLSDAHSDEVVFRDAVEKAVGRPTYVAKA